MQKQFNLKKKLIPAMCKCMVSMATHNAILKKGGVTRKSFISQLLLRLNYKNLVPNKSLGVGLLSHG